MQPINRILLPTDGSEDALEAEAYAIQLARQVQSTVTLLHVVEVVPLPVYLPGVYFEDQARHRLELLKDGRAILDFALDQFRESGIAVNAELREGSPGEAIVDLAGRGGYDIIVMGRRGLGLAQSLLIGSVSDYVARYAPCPVLIVRGEWSGKSAREAEVGAG